MSRLNFGKALLAGAMLLAGGASITAATARAQGGAFSSSAGSNAIAASAQTMTPRAAGSAPNRFSSDLAVTFAPEYARVTYQNCACFWMKGVSIDGAFNFARGLGLAAQFSEGTAGSIQPGVNADKTSFVAGPRYTMALGPRHEGRGASRIFAEGLFGIAHAYHGAFPSTAGLVSSATSSAMQFGGGYDLGLRGNLGLRLVEADWVHTGFANGADNVQNDLRLAFGVSYRWGPSR